MLRAPKAKKTVLKATEASTAAGEAFEEGPEVRVIDDARAGRKRILRNTGGAGEDHGHLPVAINAASTS